VTLERFSIDPFRWGGLAALALAAFLPGAAHAAAKRPHPPAASSEISVTLAEIPVEVTRDGQPLTGLAAADFEVLEGKRPLPIVAFESIDMESPEKPGSPPPALAARRHLLFLFDLTISEYDELKQLADGVASARELTATGLDPHDLVAVGIYLPKGELQLLLSFTTDRAAAARTLGALEGLLRGEELTKVTEESDPLRLTGLGARSLLSQVLRVDERNASRDVLESMGPVKNGNLLREGFLQLNVLAHGATVQQPEVDARRRDNIMALAEAVEGLAEVLRPVTGRKYLALFSEGFSMGLTEATGPYWRVTGGGSLLLAKLDKMVEELQRSGWVLHAVSLGGVRQGFGASGLFYLANETGGQVVEGTNRFAEGLNGALRRSTHGYLLTVQIDDVALDGAYHKVDVRLREPRHAKILHRGGYFAPLPFSQQKDVQRLAEAATLVAGEDERDDLGVNVLAVPLRAGAESTPVAIVVEVPGAPLLAPGAPRVGLEVYGYALDEKGNSSDFFAQAVDLDQAKLADRLGRGGVRVLGKLELPAGEHRLRVLVRDRGNGRFSLLSVPVSLAAPAAGTINADALFLPPVDDPWVLVRPAGASFDIHGRAVLPAAHGTLAAAGEAQVLLLGRGLAAKGTWVRDRILSGEGKAMTGGTLELLTVTPGEAGEPDLVLARLNAGSLPPGKYLLELRIGNDGTPRTVTTRPFQIAGPVR
jgi:VWFA-related protein